MHAGGGADAPLLRLLPPLLPVIAVEALKFAASCLERLACLRDGSGGVRGGRRPVRIEPGRPEQRVRVAVVRRVGFARYGVNAEAYRCSYPWEGQLDIPKDERLPIAGANPPQKIRTDNPSVGADVDPRAVALSIPTILDICAPSLHSPLLIDRYTLKVTVPIVRSGPFVGGADTVTRTPLEQLFPVSVSPDMRSTQPP